MDVFELDRKFGLSQQGITVIGDKKLNKEDVAAMRPIIKAAWLFVVTAGRAIQGKQLSGSPEDQLLVKQAMTQISNALCPPKSQEE